MRLYHFIDEKYGIQDLKEKYLKVARISDLNDPTEFLAADLSNKDFRHAMESTKESLSIDYGILCFSKNWRSLVQWAHYANRHKGLCLGFDIPDRSLAKVNYSEKRLSADEFVARAGMLANELKEKNMTAYIARHASSPEPVSREEIERLKQEFLDKEYPGLLCEDVYSDQYDKEFIKKILTTKGVEWEYEKEYRIFVQLDSCEQTRLESCRQIKDLHFVKFPSEDLMLREVIIGPRSDVTCKQIEDALGKMVDCVNVRKVGISRSEYAVGEAIDIPPDKIAAFCQRWQITRLALFGSVLRDDFGPESDVDVLAKFRLGAGHTLFDLDDMENELKDIFGRKVDLVSWRGVEASRNHLRRNYILTSAQVIYES